MQRTLPPRSPQVVGGAPEGRQRKHPLGNFLKSRREPWQGGSGNTQWPAHWARIHPKPLQQRLQKTAKGLRAGQATALGWGCPVLKPEALSPAACRASWMPQKPSIGILKPPAQAAQTLRVCLMTTCPLPSSSLQVAALPRRRTPGSTGSAARGHSAPHPPSHLARLWVTLQPRRGCPRISAIRGPSASPAKTCGVTRPWSCLSPGCWMGH